MITAWRITQSKFEKDAFTGQGAFIYGGRWNKKGMYAVYLSENLSLCALEMLVHLKSSERFSTLYSYSNVEIHENLIDDTLHTQLPHDLSYEQTQAIGTEWLKSSNKPVLKIPSSIVVKEFKYVLNPHHKDFQKVTLSNEWKPFVFDKRL